MINIGFIGLGHMGTGMATRLIQAGHELTVYNRTARRMQSLMELGAKPAATVAEACDADVVFTMLANDAALSEVSLGPYGIVEHLKPNAIHVSCSTVSVAFSAQLALAHTEKQCNFMAAPVFGRPDAAASGKLFMIAAGKTEIINRVQPLLDILGQRTFVIGTEPEKANLVKLSGNFLIGAVIESLGEAMSLVEKGGVDRHQYLEMLTSSLFNIPIYKNYGGMIADRQFEPAGFAAPLGQKDMGLVLAAADALKAPLPFANILRERFAQLMENGGEHLDWSAIGSLAAKDAALIS